MRALFPFFVLGCAGLATPSHAAPNEQEFFVAMTCFPEAGEISRYDANFEGCEAHTDQPGYDCRYSLRLCVWNLDRTVHDCVTRRLHKRATLVGGDSGWMVVVTGDAY